MYVSQSTDSAILKGALFLFTSWDMINSIARNKHQKDTNKNKQNKQNKTNYPEEQLGLL